MNYKLVCFSLFSFWIIFAAGQNQVFKFRNYSIKEGLSQSTVFQIYQDKKGFMWFATSDGLNQFDGYKFTTYKNNHHNIYSLTDSWVSRILLEDSDDELWLLTADRAINKLDLRTKNITRFLPGTHFPPFTTIAYVTEDIHKNIWFTTDAGVFLYNWKTGKMNDLSKYPGNPYAEENISTFIFSDKQGNVWFSSNNGLYRFQYKTNRFDKFGKSQKRNGLLSDSIVKIFADKNDHVWALCPNGLNLYIPEDNSFRSYPFPDCSKSPDLKWMSHSFLVSRKGLVYTGIGHLLYVFDPKKKLMYTKELSNTSGTYVTRLMEDHTGDIWIGTSKGLKCYHPLTGFLDTYFEKGSGVFNSFISYILEDKNGDIWTLGNLEQSKGSYLRYLNRKNKELEVQLNDKCNQNSIASSFVYEPFVDRTENVWLSTFDEGAIEYVPRNRKFEYYPPMPESKNFPGGNSVWGFAEDKKGNVWIPVFDKGLDKFNPSTRQFTHYSSAQHNPFHIPQFSAITITAGNDDDMWISTIGGGVVRFNTSTGKSKQYLNQPGNPKSIASNFMRKIVVDPGGKLWIGYADNGIDYFDPVSETAVHFKHTPKNKNSLASDNIWCIYLDKNRELWISCDGYIDRYNTLTKKFIHYKSKGIDWEGIIADKALCILEDSHGNMWFGTSGGGLSLFDRKTNRFRHWTEAEGLPNNVVYGIQEDDNGNLWLSTNKGLSRFDTVHHTFTNYDENDGLQSNEFNMGSSYKTSDHKMYFGGINGFNAFYPEDITSDTTRLKTIFTGFQVFNKDVPVVPAEKANLINPGWPSRIIRDNKNIYLPKNITYSGEITLTYLEKVFTLEFAALYFESPEKTTYRYKMENFDSDWNYSGTRHFATYTNLAPGEYVFNVSAANSDGIWNAVPTSLRIRILPPFWQTWWFLIIEIVLAFVIVMLIIRFRVMRLKKTKTRLEKKVRERTQEIQEKKEELELRNLQILKQKEEIAFQAQQLKAELVVHNQTSELALLRSQINPHFLFNTLNNIYSLVYQRSDDAPEAVMKLSEIMRYMLYEASAEKVILQNEINYLKSFIELQLLRIKNRDFVSFNITGSLSLRTISPMLLISFVENAFKHGIKKGNNPGITINLEVTDNKIIFEVVNFCRKGEIMNKDKTGGIGLTNVKRRLELLYPNRFQLNIRKDEDVYHVKLQIEE